MALTIEELKKANDDVVKVLEQAQARLKRLRIGALPGQLEIINKGINDTGPELIRRGIIAAHLTAATTVVKPMPPDVEAELRRLATNLDDAIRRGAIVNAGLDTVVDLLANAKTVASGIDNFTT
jgi:hypothetical protein